MGNACFISKFINSYAIFLPHLTSDHIPAVLNMPLMLCKKKKAFRFSNYIADKEEFITIVEKEWGIPIKGCNMYTLVKKLKAMKYHMNGLN